MPAICCSFYRESNTRFFATTSYSFVSALRSNAHVIVFRSQNIFSKIERGPAEIIYQITRQNGFPPAQSVDRKYPGKTNLMTIKTEVDLLPL